MPTRTHTKIVTPAPKAEPELRRENIKSPEFVSIYANDVQIQTSPWDIRLVLGQVGDLGMANQQIVTIKEVAELRVSPQLAKRLTRILIEQLKTYEERFGQIPAPPID